MYKYQYWIREYLFRALASLPTFFQKKILSFWVKRQKKTLSNLLTPAQIILYVTNRCNARCRHCFYWREVAGGKKKELTLKQITKIAKSLKHSLNTLSITGGEPFLRKDLSLIVKTFSKINRTRKINIVTNGFFTKEILRQTKKIIKYPVDLNIQVSLDGLQKVHDQIRRVAIFTAAVETIRQLSEISLTNKNFQVTIQCTITKYNLNEMEKLIKFVKNNLSKVHLGFQLVRSSNFDVYNIDYNFLSGLDYSQKKPLLSIRQMEKALKIMEKNFDTQNSLLSSYVNVMNRHIVKIKKKKKSFVKCLAGIYDAVIWPDGQVSMCEFTKPFARLSDYNYDFYRLWTSKAAISARKKIKFCFCTHSCNLMNAMQFDEKVLLEVLNEQKSRLS